MRALLECPKLISRKDLGKQIKEIQFLFNLYHQVSQAEVNEIFRGFPYLYLGVANTPGDTGTYVVGCTLV
jgi:hypothetical protein